MTYDTFCINNLTPILTIFPKLLGFFSRFDKRFCTRLFVSLLPNSFKGGFKSGHSFSEGVSFKGGNESKPSVMKGRSSQSSGCNASAMKSRPNEFV
ncbi:hypothetical protein CDAR_227151 [Caerostris darwini]|uniref:Uncharacterized protein n=1 Tax=Caerostris darwini TaxID=1538125 RepID=A0AAV4P9L8_9ARAC|nr:hypothetical protein CDAR_227151 [Caerostris darwini]